MLPSKRTTVAILAVLAVGSLTGVSFAQTTATADATVSSATSFAEVTAAGTSGPNGQAPTWSPVVGAPDEIGDAEAGDLYIIDTGDYTGDILATIYLNNPAALSKSYSYLNLAVTAYEDDGTGAWGTPVAGQNATTGDYTTYLSLTGGYVTLPLTQAASGTFAISIDAGSFYLTSDSGTLNPQFFIDVKPA